jgi:hypothetical protein
MDRLTLDQAPSESVLLRVLYVIKFLRALLLHVVLAGIAFAVWKLTGVIGLYPTADNTIRSLRADAIVNQQGGGNPIFWTIALVIGFVIVFGMIVWMYRAITAVRPIALKFLAAAAVVLMLLSIANARHDLRFAFLHLDRSFAVLATIGVLGPIGFFAVVATSLWQVSRVPERSSFVATLDPRLAPGPWAYVNKLLDLPRTPLQTPRSALAYVLALTGAIVLVMSLMHLLTVGGASNATSTLLSICKDDLLPNCVAISSKLAVQLAWTLPLAVVGIKAAAWLQSLAKRLGGVSVSDVLKHPDDRFVLYLRPFDTDDVVLPTPKLPPWSRLFSYRPLEVRVEEELFDVADGHLPLIAVGKPGTQDATEGGVAYRAFLADSEWQGYVADKIRRAERIVLVMKASAGVRWEIERVVAEGAAPKTLFLFDPALADAERVELEHALAPVLQGSEASDAAIDARAIGFWFRGATRVEVVNANRSATSYRTAFSTFLAEPHG